MFDLRGQNEGFLGPSSSRLLEDCAGAVGALSSTLSRHPLEDAWSVRFSIRQALRLARMDGRLVDEFRLAGRLAGLPLPFRQDEGAELLALGYARRLLRHWQGDWAAGVGQDELEIDDEIGLPAIADPRDDDPALIRQPRLFVICTRLAAAREAVAAWSERSLLGNMRPALAHLHLPTDLARYGLCAHPLPLLATQIGQASTRPPEEFLRAFLVALREDAEEGLKFLNTLTLSWEAGRRRIGPRRSHSRLPALVDLATVHPILAPIGVSRALACSVRAASMLLDELVEIGVLIEVSGRRSWKAYASPDAMELKEDIGRGWRRFMMSNRTVRPGPLVDETGAPLAPSITVYGAVEPEKTPEEIDCDLELDAAGEGALPRPVFDDDLDPFLSAMRLGPQEEEKKENPVVHERLAARDLPSTREPLRVDLSGLIADLNRTIKRVEEVLAARTQAKDPGDLA